MESDLLIKIESPREHYTAKACAVWCFDARFSEAFDGFLEKRGFSKSDIDLVKRAGGAQALAAESGFGKDDATDEIKKSIMLHRPERLILMVHMDCGAYGGSKAFESDHAKEWEHHTAELARADKFARREFPEIKEVECWIADFDGLRRVGV